MAQKVFSSGSPFTNFLCGILHTCFVCFRKFVRSLKKHCSELNFLKFIRVVHHESESTDLSKFYLYLVVPSSLGELPQWSYRTVIINNGFVINCW